MLYQKLKVRYTNAKRRFSLGLKRNKLTLLQEGEIPKQHEIMALLNIYEALIYHLSLTGHTADDGLLKAFELKTYLRYVGESEQPSEAALREFSGLVLAPFVGIYTEELNHARQTVMNLSLDPDTEKTIKIEVKK